MPLGFLLMALLIAMRLMTRGLPKSATLSDTPAAPAEH
jgi:hypothetical protein